MARAKNKVIAGDYVRKKVARKFTLYGRKVVIDLGYFRLHKKIRIDKSTVAAYEVLDETSSKSAVGAVGRAAVGSFFLGLPGLAAALATKNRRAHVVAIQFKNGKRSLIEIDDKLYRAIMTSMF